MEISTWIAQGATVASAAIALAAALAAWRGLSTWRQQLKGSDQYQLTKDVLLLSCRARDTFREIRSPLVFGGETEDKPKNVDESIYVYHKRFYSNNSLWSDLSAKQIEVEVLLGKEIAEQMQPLQNVIKKYWSTMFTCYGACSGEGAPSLYDDRRNSYFKKARPILMRGSAEDDEFQGELDLALEKLQLALRKHLNP
jgi:hypothetical protein